MAIDDLLKKTYEQFAAKYDIGDGAAQRFEESSTGDPRYAWIKVVPNGLWMSWDSLTVRERTMVLYAAYYAYFAGKLSKP
jgi:hypothetical protein